MVPKISDLKKDKVDSNNNDEKLGYKNNEREYPSLSGSDDDDYKVEIVWKNVVIFLYLHTAAIYGFTLEKKLSSLIFGWVCGLSSAFGTTVGAHRLYTHRSYKANRSLQILLLIWQTMAVQNSMYTWCRDHRMHHKYTDTNADPHNSERGFFFSHIGWLMCKKHPDVKKFGAKIDMSDLETDPLVMFQHKYYFILALIFGFIIPIYITCLLGESFHIVWYGHIFRYMLGLNLVWCINSVAHFWGTKPYDKNISSTDSYLVGTLGVGEGWHNYHHVFPFDYKCAEKTRYWCNLSLGVLDFFAYIGWATDLKEVSKETIDKRALRTGDGSREISSQIAASNVELEVLNNEATNSLWGWDDSDITSDIKNCVDISYKKFD
ncbi:hypothetical protein ACKWTF_012511 [Chironomus riparius]